MVGVRQEMTFYRLCLPQCLIFLITVSDGKGSLQKKKKKVWNFPYLGHLPSEPHTQKLCKPAIHNNLKRIVQDETDLYCIA